MQQRLSAKPLIKTFFLILTILLLAEGLYMYLSLWQYEKNRFKADESELKLIINEAKAVPDALFDTLISKDNVISIFELASTQDEQIKSEVRNKLYTLFKSRLQKNAKVWCATASLSPT